MSTEQGAGEKSSSEGTHTPPLGVSLEERDLGHTEPALSQSERISPPKPKEEGDSSELEKKPRASQSQATISNETTETTSSESPRQVIAVSASKGPAAFFNLARKFLVTDETCDLSALEGAIVSAVDAAHLLERSQLATIVRVHTSYVTVEPKRRKQATQQGDQDEEVTSQAQPVSSSSTEPPNAAITPDESMTTAQRRDDTSTQSGARPPRQSGSRGAPSGGRELKRARIVITVQRTESYKRWLDDNPLQAIIAGSTDDTELERAQRDPKHE